MAKLWVNFGIDDRQLAHSRFDFNLFYFNYIQLLNIKECDQKYRKLLINPSGIGSSSVINTLCLR